jgi:hypothetical protein
MDVVLPLALMGIAVLVGVGGAVLYVRRLLARTEAELKEARRVTDEEARRRADEILARPVDPGAVVTRLRRGGF